MPAEDHYHKPVVNALKKAGWTVLPHQPSLTVGVRRLWVDIEAEKTGQTILVEVKGFENLPSPVAYLQGVIGQYILYKAIIKYLQIQVDLYLAIPDHVYAGIFTEPIGAALLQEVDVQFILFSIDHEEIIQWIT